MKEHLFDKRVVQRALQEGLLDEDVYQRMLDALPDVSHKLQAAGASDELRSSGLSARDNTLGDDDLDDDLDDEDEDEDEDEDDSEAEDDEDGDEGETPDDTALASPAAAVADVAVADRAYGDVSDNSEPTSSADDEPTPGAYSNEP